MSPKVSVLIATYNRSQFIGRAIKSVTGQTFKDWELIVADDGSTDDTEKVVRELAGKDKRIRYFKNAHTGRISKISNFGLKLAQGEYIAILDDDDWWSDPEKLKKQVEFLDGNPEYVACGGGIIIVDEKNQEKIRVFKPQKDEEIKENALVANPIANATALFRRHAAQKVDLYDESMLQFADWDFWLKVGLVGKLYNFPEYFTCYQMWNKGMSFSKQRETSASAIRIVERYKNQYPKYPKAIILARVYFFYTRLPGFVKRFLNPTLSKLKKTLFSGRKSESI